MLVEQQANLRRLTLNRPEQCNALDVPLIAALDEQITAADADPDTAVLLVDGAGASFCAGGDFR